VALWRRLPARGYRGSGRRRWSRAVPPKDLGPGGSKRSPNPGEALRRAPPAAPVRFEARVRIRESSDTSTWCLRVRALAASRTAKLPGAPVLPPRPRGGTLKLLRTSRKAQALRSREAGSERRVARSWLLSTTHSSATTRRPYAEVHRITLVTWNLQRASARPHRVRNLTIVGGKREPRNRRSEPGSRNRSRRHAGTDTAAYRQQSAKFAGVTADQRCRDDANRIFGRDARHGWAAARVCDGDARPAMMCRQLCKARSAIASG
jgi:hypothetical protein